MRSRSRALLTLLAATLTLAVLGSAPAAAHHGGGDTIHPGVQTSTVGGGQCTSNFVFEGPGDGDGDDSDYFLGQAAHCAGTGGATATNGCSAGHEPVGTPVHIQGASEPGTLAYTSWETMQKVGESDVSTCQYNDFALVRVAEADQERVDPTMAVYGGPEGPGASTGVGQRVYTYGNSSLRQGAQLLSPKAGLVVQSSAWNHTVYTLTPGIPGDSGSAVLDADGDALGILVTLALAPLPASNGVTDLGQALQYANAHAGDDDNNLPNEGVTLETGEESFRAALLPLGPLQDLGGQLLP